MEKGAKKKEKNETTNDIKRDPYGKGRVLEFYSNFYTQKELPISELVIEAFAKDLVKWASEDDEALKVSQFYLSKGVAYSTYVGWVAKYPCLKVAHDAALRIIGNRREVGAIKNKYNQIMITKVQYLYDDEWWTAEVARENLRAESRKKAEGGDKNITVVLDHYGTRTVDEEHS